MTEYADPVRWTSSAKPLKAVPEHLSGSLDWAEDQQPASPTGASETTNRKPYRYSALTDGYHQFRLIELLPGNGNADIRVRLKPHNLDEVLEYEALSYAWDVAELPEASVSDQPKVLVGSQYYLCISRGLAEAFVQLRRPKGIRKLWIDQICIHQQDDEEKSAQIQVMREIYANAANTIIWLGAKRSTDDEALKIIASAARLQDELSEAVVRIQEKSRQSWEEAFNSLMIMNMVELYSNGVQSTYGFHNLDGFRLDCVLQFYRKRWFSRIWAFQEVVVSKSKVVRCGDSEIEWERVGFFASWCFYKLGAAISSDHLRGIESAFNYYWYSLQRHRRFPLTQMLEVSRRFDATEDVDKVFAVLGLTDEIQHGIELPPALRVNTSLDALTVYESTARYIIAKRQDLAILSSVGYAQLGDPVRPSWVPRWNEKPRVSPIWWINERNEYNFWACRSTDPHLAAPEVNGRLTVQGIAVSQVHHIYTPVFHNEFDFDYGSVWADRPGWAKIRAWIAQVAAAFLANNSDSLLWGSNALDKLYSELSMVLTAGRRRDRSLITENGALYEQDQARRQEHKTYFSAFLHRLDNSNVSESNLSVPALQAFQRMKAHADVYRIRSAYDGEYYVPTMLACAQRRLFQTKSGLLGLGPSNTRVGDLVCVLQGGRVPFILRPVSDRDISYLSIGESYVEGLMLGEYRLKAVTESRQFFLV